MEQMTTLAVALILGPVIFTLIFGMIYARNKEMNHIEAQTRLLKEMALKAGVDNEVVNGISEKCKI